MPGRKENIGLHARVMAGGQGWKEIPKTFWKKDG